MDAVTGTKVVDLLAQLDVRAAVQDKQELLRVPVDVGFVAG